MGARIAEDVATGVRSATEVVRGALEAIHRQNADLGAFLQVFDEHATRRGAEIDAMRAGGQSLGPLAGVPVAVKDNMALDHGRTTCSSRFLEHYESPYTATAVQRLIDAGAVIVGKTSLDEFAMGSSCERCAFGGARNPHDLDRVPGGSSGGSAAAVAAEMVPIALGSDTGGSIRQPAAFCGAVGLKPTYGRVSRYGLVAFASSLDQIGPITHSVRDAALTLNAIAGLDPQDSTSADVAVEDFGAQLGDGVDGVRIALIGSCLSDDNHPAVNEAVCAGAATLESAGATIVEAELPHLSYAIDAYYVVAPAEASSNLARFDGVRYGRRADISPTAGEGLVDLYERSRSEGFGDEVQRRIILGTYVLSAGYYDAYYARALKTRRLIKQDFDRLFERGTGGPEVDAVLLPTTPGPAFRRGAIADPVEMYLQDIYTVAANMAGLPAISMPTSSVDIEGSALPIGVQLIGDVFEEAKLLRVAAALEG
ncbi:MAG: Asp-tRNA(Asn)/Glu-tRNA(Gln) amidotransferase subunit GatA [Planctomycetota bacterium]